MKLRKKKNLVGLKLEFGYEDEIDIKQMEVALECLQPDENLKVLTIKAFPGLMFLSWMYGSSSSNIVELRLEECKNCIQMPALGSLGSLEVLVIKGLESVRHIGSELYGVGVEISFPKLKKLELVNMEELRNWEIPFSYFKQIMPCLSSLRLNNCLELLRLPDLEGFEHLCDLEIRGCPKLRAPTEGLGKLDSLEALVLSDVGIEVFAADRNGESSFPELTTLILRKLPEWEETSVISTTTSIMPNLQHLILLECGKFHITCSLLTDGMQPKLPLQLERLALWGDVGMFSKSLLSVLITDRSYSNLKSVSISRSSHSSLPHQD